MHEHTRTHTHTHTPIHTQKLGLLPYFLSNLSRFFPSYELVKVHKSNQGVVASEHNTQRTMLFTFISQVQRDYRITNLLF